MRLSVSPRARGDPGRSKGKPERERERERESKNLLPCWPSPLLSSCSTPSSHSRPKATRARAARPSNASMEGDGGGGGRRGCGAEGGGSIASFLPASLPSFAPSLVLTARCGVRRGKGRGRRRHAALRSTSEWEKRVMLVSWCWAASAEARRVLGAAPQLHRVRENADRLTD